MRGVRVYEGCGFARGVGWQQMSEGGEEASVSRRAERGEGARRREWRRGRLVANRACSADLARLCDVEGGRVEADDEHERERRREEGGELCLVGET